MVAFAHPLTGAQSKPKANRGVAAALVVLVAVIVAAGITFAMITSLMPEPTVTSSLGYRMLFTAVTYPDTIYSLATLSFGLLIGLLFLGTRGGRTLKRTRSWRMLRIVFAPGYLRHRSHGLDVLFVIANTKVLGLVLGWFIVSALLITQYTYAGLVGLFGPLQATTLSDMAVTVIGSIMLYLAYEFGYYIDHVTSHRFAFFWQFHRVHHEAEVLSPLTTWRMHPVDSIKFANILALTGGIMNGALHFVFGLSLDAGTAFKSSFFLFAAAYLFLQLQHTQLWIPFTGLLGRLFISPAHHQIHHSTNPAHFNKNMGSALAVFDWLFGTLHIPSRTREKLSFGVVPDAHEGLHNPHTLVGSLCAPFVRGWRHCTALVKIKPAGVDRV